MRSSRSRLTSAALAALLGAALARPALGQSVVVVDRDDVEVTASAILRFIDEPIDDDEGDGVVHVTAPGVIVDLGGGHLRGAPVHRAPDGLTGIGIRIAAEGVTVRNGALSGFKVAVLAQEADGLVIEDLDVSGNFRQRLGSTVEREDPADWLRPHENDDNEWLEAYGAGIWVEDSRGVTVRRVRARDVQNGIVLDGVRDSRVYDNDCSFLSGWGLALWRSNRNLISRNAFDFCVRGYSHGVYNRGQDSAGILLFEQCSWNTIVRNSVTHGGDGVFLFAGREALGETGDHPSRWHLRRGSNHNLFIGNDLSHAAAHGLEATFSFDNTVLRNRFVDNAICGVWGGYSRSMRIIANRFEANGAMGVGQERGGINIEHGRGCRIEHNEFERNACGVFLWWDEDAHLRELPWVRTNGADSSGHQLLLNTFVGDEIGLQVRRSQDIRVLGLMVDDVAVPLDVDDASDCDTVHFDGRWPDVNLPVVPSAGSREPVGARGDLAGRDRIVMTRWGPWDHESPALRPVRVDPAADAHVWEPLGIGDVAAIRARGGTAPSVAVDEGPGGRPRVIIRAPGGTGVHPYRLVVEGTAGSIDLVGAHVRIPWQVTIFPWRPDPRVSRGAWRLEATRDEAVTFDLTDLRLEFGTGGPAGIAGAPPEAAALPADGFGTVSTARVRLSAGRWRLRTRSDDGIHVSIDGTTVIEDWTWHPLRRHVHDFVVPRATEIDLRVEHFEIDGWAELGVELELVR